MGADLDLSLLPAELQSLASLISRYAESDDVGRAELLEQASDEELRELSEAPSGHWPTINAFLDANVRAEPGPRQDVALALDSFSQAALEARYELKERTRELAVRQRARRQGSVLTVAGAVAGLGCALGVLGVLLDWVTVTGGAGGEIARKGIDTKDGKIALALLMLGFVATLFSAMFRSRGGFIVVGLLGAGCLAIAIIDGRDAANRLANVNIDAAPAGFFHASVGTGLWLLGIGGALMLAAPFMGFSSSAEPSDRR